MKYLWMDGMGELVVVVEREEYIAGAAAADLIRWKLVLRGVGERLSGHSPPSVARWGGNFRLQNSERDRLAA
jgi:hypothetical protein